MDIHGDVHFLPNVDSPYSHGCVLLCHLENSPDSFKIVSTFPFVLSTSKPFETAFLALPGVSLNILSRLSAFIVLHTSSCLV